MNFFAYFCNKIQPQFDDKQWKNDSDYFEIFNGFKIFSDHFRLPIIIRFPNSILKRSIRRLTTLKRFSTERLFSSAYMSRQKIPTMRRQIAEQAQFEITITSWNRRFFFRIIRHRASMQQQDFTATFCCLDSEVL